MPRTHYHTDPEAYLKNLVATRGASGHYATEFYGAHLLFNPGEHVHSDTYDDTMELLRTWAEEEEDYRKLVTYLTHATSVNRTYKVSSYFGMNGVTLNVNAERKRTGHLSVMFPQINAAKVGLDVEVFSHIAQLFGKWLESSNMEVRFFICFSFLRWEDMEEEGILTNLEYESN